MAIKNSGKAKKIDYKARLEKKLYLARESPESVFDVSECNLKQLPSNIFSLCRVFRKDALYVQNNLLSSLQKGGSLEELHGLKILNLSSNKFRKLPNTIHFLKCLQVLNISKNELEELPSEIGDLHNLMWLNASNNKLHDLPSSIGNCQNLERLNVTSNKNLTKLPTTLGRLKCIVELEIDHTIQYPPREICESGLSNIINFLKKELNDDLENPSTSASVVKTRDSQLQEQIILDQKVIIDKLHEMEMGYKCDETKNKLLTNIKNDQHELCEKLSKIQEQKNRERKLLIQLCKQEEENSSIAVSRILDNKKKLQMNIFEVCEKERKSEEEKLLNYALNKNNGKVTAVQEILASMHKTVKEEVEKHHKANMERKLGALNTLATESILKSDTLEELMKKTNENKKELLNVILHDEQLQKSAVISFLEKSDATSWELAKQISIIENKLAELTRLELSKKKLETDCQLVALCENRISLTKMLVELFNEQTQRRHVLQQRIQLMENVKQQNQDDNNFWLEQYNILFNSKSNEMVTYLEALNSNLVYQLFINGVFQYLPLLKDVALNEDKLQELDLNTLNEAGIKNIEDRKNVLHAIHMFLNERRQRLEPSAPECIEPSAPLLTDSDFESANMCHKCLVLEECIICLDVKPTLVFVPCGHVCCCHNCFKGISICPMCRQNIERAHTAGFL